MAYAGLCRVLVEQGNIDAALLTAEKGRAQALTDLIKSSFCDGRSQHKGGDEDLAVLQTFFQTLSFRQWIKLTSIIGLCPKEKQVQLQQSKLNGAVFIGNYLRPKPE